MNTEFRNTKYVKLLENEANYKASFLERYLSEYQKANFLA